VEDSAGKFRFLLYGREFKFEPRYRYPVMTMPRELLFCFRVIADAIAMPKRP
jgi:hypothetical protein